MFDPKYQGRVRFGAAYYPEYHLDHLTGRLSTGQAGRGAVLTERLDQDLDLMAAAHFTTIRLGESVWSTWEPSDGVFDLDWIEPVLDGAHARGIEVVLGTPTYAVPPWLQTAHPEIAAERGTGQPIPWGARQEVDYTHPAFLFHAERVIRAILAQHATHPAVVGFQVDNEPGLELFHSDATFARFRDWLRHRYGEAAELNREWGLTYWSHRLGHLGELWRPDGNTFPQYDLAWRTFQCELTERFIAWQEALVDEYRRPDQFTTTCLQVPRRGIDEERICAHLDVAAGNPYYGMQDHLDAGKELPQPNYWTTTGVAGLVRQADRLYAAKQARFLVTETNAQTIGPAEWNHPPFEGQLRQAAYLLVSRGAAMIEYWHWGTIPFGAETYWGGILPHSGRPGRIYREIAGLGGELADLDLDGYEPDADAALLWSTPSRQAMQFMPPLGQGGAPDQESYEKIFDSFHRGVFEAGAQSRIIHTSQALAAGAARLAERFPVLVAAGIYIASDADLELWRQYAELGGHLILGPRTGYADTEARIRPQVAPANLSGAAGAWYEEFSNIDTPVAVEALAGAGLEIDGAAGARLWIDGLVADGAEVLARYSHPHFGRFPAITTRVHGLGRITMVGCLPSGSLARSLFAWALPGARTHLPVTIASGCLPGGRRVRFVFNWGWQPRELPLPCDVSEPATGRRLASGSLLTLGPWAAVPLIEHPSQPEPTMKGTAHARTHN